MSGGVHGRVKQRPHTQRRTIVGGAVSNDPPDGAQSAAGPGDEQTRADREQTLADSEQTLSDADQTLSDSDQSSADQDQRAAEQDQAASDRDLAGGVDQHEHDATRDIREHTARRREQTGRARVDVADKRDEVASARDLAALARDHAADARDLASARRDAADAAHGTRAAPGADTAIRAAERRERAAQQRARAAEQRTVAAHDRQRAAADREQAAHDREHALADRETLKRQLAMAETDPLTGARARAAGLDDLDTELNRCRRTGSSLVVAYVDSIGLKTLNDTEGHGAGDELLKRVVQLIRKHVRPYDLIIRLGGDEFLCAMSNMTALNARRRFSAVAAALAGPPSAGAIRTGFAELRSNETATELIARADKELVDSRSTPVDARALDLSRR